MKLIQDQAYYQKRDSKAKSGIVVNSHINEVILTVKGEIPTSLKNSIVLDVGSGTGEYCFGIEKYVKKVVGVEPYKEAYEQALRKRESLKSKVEFRNFLIEDFKTRDKFDLVLNLTVIEHMPNAKRSFAKIFSLMKKGGVMYLTAPNKLWPIESHYKLLFLSLLPLPLANLYLKITKRGQSYQDSAYSKSYFGMKNFLDKFPCQYSFILPSNIDAPYLGCGKTDLSYKLIKKVGINLIRRFPIFWMFSKGFVILVRKTG